MRGSHLGQPFAARGQGPNFVRSGRIEFDANVGLTRVNQVRQASPIQEGLPLRLGVLNLGVLQIREV